MGETPGDTGEMTGGSLGTEETPTTAGPGTFTGVGPRGGVADARPILITF